MCARTVTRAHQLGLAVELLPRGYDIDIEADLLRLRGDLERAAGEPDYPDRTAACVRELFPAAP